MDFHRGSVRGPLWVRDDLGGREELPVQIFFRGEGDLSGCERAALGRVRGRVLDVGAGAGALSLILVGRGFEVTSIDVLPEAVKVMRSRGLPDAHCSWLEHYRPNKRFETILVLMNGAGLAGTLEGLPRLLAAAGGLLAPAGQILMDSTDPMPTAGGGQAVLEREDGRYLGEVQFQLEYSGQRGPPFPYLLVDPNTFREVAEGAGWMFEVLHHEVEGGYLARLVPDITGPDVRGP